MSPTRFIHWLAGHDLAGTGAVTEFEHSLESVVAANTRLSDGIMSERPIGRVDYTLTENGFLDERGASLRRALNGGLAATGFEGHEAGKQVIIASNLGVKKQSIPPELDGFSKISLDYYLREGGQVYEEAQLLWGGRRVTNNAPNAPHNGYRIDLGSGHTGGAVVALMVDPDIVARGAERVTLNVTHANSTSPSGWTALPVAGGTVSARHNINGNATESLLIVPSTQAIRRYVAVSWSWGSQSGFRVDNAGGYNAGHTSLHLDGRGQTYQNIVVGDVFTVAGDSTVHTVTGGGTTPGVVASEFDIAFTPGLGSNVADNAIISTVAGSHRSFKFLAAIALL